MKYLQRLSKELRHYDSLPYLLHCVNDIEIRIKTLIKYNDERRFIESNLFKDSRFLILDYCMKFGRIKFIQKLISLTKSVFELLYVILNSRRSKVLKFFKDFIIKIYNMFHEDSLLKGEVKIRTGSYNFFNAHLAPGSLECLKLFLEWKLPIDRKLLFKEFLKCPKRMELIYKKWLPNGPDCKYPECIKILHDSNPELYDIDIDFNVIGNIRLMKLFHEWNNSIFRCYMDEAICSLHSLKLFHKWGVPSASSSLALATWGSLKILKLLHKWRIGIPINEDAMDYAASGRPKCMKLLHKWNASIGIHAMSRAVSGYPECMKLLHDWNAPVDETIASAYACEGHPECIQLLQEWGLFHPDTYSMCFAARGYLDIMKFLYKLGVPITSECMTYASCGYPECMKLLHEWNAPIDENAMACAFRISPECMKLLHEWNAPVSLQVILNPEFYATACGIDSGFQIEMNTINRYPYVCMELLREWGYINSQN